jgi:hypothetical protein
VAGFGDGDPVPALPIKGIVQHRAVAFDNPPGRCVGFRTGQQDAGHPEDVPAVNKRRCQHGGGVPSPPVAGGNLVPDLAALAGEARGEPMFASWCQQRQLHLFQARRADIELFARDLEGRGRARATITRRLCTVAGFYRYAVEEELLDHSPRRMCGGRGWAIDLATAARHQRDPWQSLLSGGHAGGG